MGCWTFGHIGLSVWWPIQLHLPISILTLDLYRNVSSSPSCTHLSHTTVQLNSHTNVFWSLEMTVVGGLIYHNYESSYRREVEDIVDWCGLHNLQLNVGKMKEMVVDLGGDTPTLHWPLEAVEMVHSFKYPGVHIYRDLTWTDNTRTNIKKAHQCLYFLRKLSKAGLNSSVLATFNQCVESTLTLSIIIWYRNCSATNMRSYRSRQKSHRGPLTIASLLWRTSKQEGAGQLTFWRTPPTLPMTL